MCAIPIWILLRLSGRFKCKLIHFYIDLISFWLLKINRPSFPVVWHYRDMMLHVPPHHILMVTIKREKEKIKFMEKRRLIQKGLIPTLPHPYPQKIAVTILFLSINYLKIVSGYSQCNSENNRSKVYQISLEDHEHYLSSFDILGTYSPFSPQFSL